MDIMRKSSGTVCHLPRATFELLLNRIEEFVLEESTRLSQQPGPVRDFLFANPLPPALHNRLPDKFRCFCLALNALKQWTVAAQAEVDKCILGSNARAECIAAADSCIVSGSCLNGSVELHHPVRDGRPPIPLNKHAHSSIEGQIADREQSDPTRSTLLALKRQRNKSWVLLRRGCMDLLGDEVQHSTPKMRSESRTFARKAAKVTSLGYRELIEWLDRYNLGGQG